MHRFKEIDPWQHAQRMVAAIAPVSGSVLDTTTGLLGYTAILAARTAENVTTIELDPGVQTIARRNPWSQELFANSRITQVMGDAIRGCANCLPTRALVASCTILQALKLAGELYSGAFYHELYRILKRGGRLFHYIGDPRSKSGSVVTHGRRAPLAGDWLLVHRAARGGIQGSGL